MCDLELVALFDNTVIEQGVFFRNDFLVNRTADCHFYVAGCLITLFQPMSVSIFTLNTAAASAKVRPSSVYLVAVILNLCHTPYKNYMKFLVMFQGN